jgi:hypothetical protein
MCHMHAWLNGESLPYINKLCRRKNMYVCLRALYALYSKMYSIKLKCIALSFMLYNVLTGLMLLCNQMDVNKLQLQITST